MDVLYEEVHRNPANLAFNNLLSFPRGFLMDLRSHPLYSGSEHQGSDLHWIISAHFWNLLYKPQSLCLDDQNSLSFPCTPGSYLSLQVMRVLQVWAHLQFEL